MHQKTTITENRMQLLALDKKLTVLRRDYMQKQQNQLFDAMRLDLELGQDIKAFTENEKLTAKVTREFVVRVEGVL